MKIGIITLPLHTNYGGVLQAYALQEVLKGMGHHVSFLNKGSKNFVRQNIFEPLAEYISPISSRFNVLTYYYRGNNFSSFIRKNIDDFYFVATHNSNNVFDALIVGSDQVWRKWGNSQDYRFFFFDFAEEWIVKRYSYAASLGTDQWSYNEKETEEICHLIKKFDAVSLREKEAVDLLRNMFHINGSWNIDPTLLLTKDDYIEKLRLKQKRNKKLVSYILDGDNSKKRIVETIEDLFNTTVLENGEPKIKQNGISGKLPAIEIWLENFISAENIITDSFHGTAFSINFNKNFVVLSNALRGQSRLRSILELFDLDDRIVSTEEEAIKVIQTPIDWEVVNKKLEAERKKSIDYLRNI